MKAFFHFQTIEISALTGRTLRTGRELSLLLSAGRLGASVGDRHFSMHVNDYLILGPYEEARLFAHQEDATAQAFVLRMDWDTLAEAGADGEDLLSPFSAGSLAHNRLIPATNNTNLLIRNFFRSLQRGSKLSMGRSYCYHLLALTAVLAGRALTAEKSAPERREQQSLSVNDVYYYIRDHLGEDLSLDALAEKLYFNKYYIAHEFKRTAGMPIHQYIVKKRLEHALDLLRRGMPVHQAAAAAGFSDYAHFIRTFKKEYGLPPKKYCRMEIKRKFKDE